MATALTPAEIAAFNTSLHTQFNKGLGQQNKDWMAVAKEVPSSAASNTYAWLTKFPAFREWVGARVHKEVAERAYVVHNRKFENTLDVPREDFEDNNLGQYSAVAESFGEAIGDLKNDLIFDAVKAGFTETCYDNQFYFDTDHPVAANEDGTGAVVTVSNMQAGTEPPWVLLCTKRSPKPFYLQNRTGAPEFAAKTNAGTSDAVFENDVYTWGGRWRGNHAYGFWQLAFGSKAELTPDNFNAAYNSMLTVKADGQRPLNNVPDTILVGASNRVKANEMFLTRTLPGGGDNPNFGLVKVVVNPLMD